MVKAVFTTKIEPTYDDLPEVRYHFPRTYLNSVEQSVGDWILYYEPRRSSGSLSSRGGRQSYFATAKIDRIERDLIREDHFYAYVVDYLDFSNPVSFSNYYEKKTRKEDGSTNKGTFGRAVRNLPDHDYDVIISAGFSQALELTPPKPTVVIQAGLSEPATTFERPMVESIVNRPFRDRAFRHSICEVYGSTCAMTGVKIVTEDNKVEVEAAHIRPVSDLGPDSIRNGLALTRTAHWMFDKGIISAEDDGTILLARDHIPKKINDILNPDGHLLLPERADFKPHPKFLHYHRENIFVG